MYFDSLRLNSVTHAGEIRNSSVNFLTLFYFPMQLTNVRQIFRTDRTMSRHGWRIFRSISPCPDTLPFNYFFRLLFKSLCGSFTLDHNPKRGVSATITFTFLRGGGKYSVTPLTANDRWLYGAAGFATVPGDDQQTQLSRRPSASKSCKLVRAFAVKRTDRARSL